MKCFCDCNAKLNSKLNNLLDNYKKKPHIKYEYEDEVKENSKQTDADIINHCPCSCHGMYNENKSKTEENKKLVYFLSTKILK